MATREITKDNFADTVTGEGIVLLDCWASWCLPCRSFAPVFEAASERHLDVVFGKLDAVNQEELTAKLGVMAFPTVMAFREGVLVFEQPGALPARQLDQLVEAVGGLDMDDIRAEIAKRGAEVA
jgi:thioredoxin 1